MRIIFVIVLFIVVALTGKSEANVDCGGRSVKTWAECAIYANQKHEQELERQREEDALRNPPRKKSIATIYFRNSLEDLKSFTEPNPVEKAKGFQVSWADDRFRDRQTTVIQGLIGIGYARYHEIPQPIHSGSYLLRDSLGFYVAADRVKDTLNPGANKDILISGMRYEMLARNPFRVSHFLGVSTHVVSGFDGDTQNWKVGLDYTIFGAPGRDSDNTILNYLNYPYRKLDANSYWVLEVNPRLRAEYRGNMSTTPGPLFATDDRLFRVGGYISASLSGNTKGYKVESPYLFEAEKAGEIPILISRSIFRLSYGWWHDTISGREYNLFQAAYTYNLNQSGQAGLTFSYELGEHEDTGIYQNIFKVALGIKLDLTPEYPANIATRN